MSPKIPFVSPNSGHIALAANCALRFILCFLFCLLLLGVLIFAPIISGSFSVNGAADSNFTNSLSPLVLVFFGTLPAAFSISFLIGGLFTIWHLYRNQTLRSIRLQNVGRVPIILVFAFFAFATVVLNAQWDGDVRQQYDIFLKTQLSGKKPIQLNSALEPLSFARFKNWVFYIPPAHAHSSERGILGHAYRLARGRVVYAGVGRLASRPGQPLRLENFTGAKIMARKPFLELHRIGSKPLVNEAKSYASVQKAVALIKKASTRTNLPLNNRILSEPTSERLSTIFDSLALKVAPAFFFLIFTSVFFPRGNIPISRNRLLVILSLVSAAGCGYLALPFFFEHSREEWAAFGRPELIIVILMVLWPGFRALTAAIFPTQILGNLWQRIASWRSWSPKVNSRTRPRFLLSFWSTIKYSINAFLARLMVIGILSYFIMVIHRTLVMKSFGLGGDRAWLLLKAQLLSSIEPACSMVALSIPIVLLSLFFSFSRTRVFLRYRLSSGRPSRLIYLLGTFAGATLIFAVLFRESVALDLKEKGEELFRVGVLNAKPWSEMRIKGTFHLIEAGKGLLYYKEARGQRGIVHLEYPIVDYLQVNTCLYAGRRGVINQSQIVLEEGHRFCLATTGIKSFSNRTFPHQDDFTSNFKLDRPLRHQSIFALFPLFDRDQLLGVATAAYIKALIFLRMRPFVTSALMLFLTILVCSSSFFQRNAVTTSIGLSIISLGAIAAVIFL